MKTIAVLSLLLVAMSGAQQKPGTPPAIGSPELEAVLSQMDKAAEKFKSLEADLQWDNTQRIGDYVETTTQTGKVYFKRSKDTKAMFDITTPHPMQVLFKGGTLSLYKIRSNQVTEHKAANKSEIEAFLELGFGARGHDLLKSFEVKMAGWETVDRTRVAKLELVAKSEKVRNMFSQFIMWIDPKQDVPLKQQVLQPDHNYWSSHYSHFKLNSRISDDVFRLKTNSATEIIRQ